jgi:hypothetical protein
MTAPRIASRLPDLHKYLRRDSPAFLVAAAKLRRVVEPVSRSDHALALELLEAKSIYGRSSAMILGAANITMRCFR